jgi:hypothetical protein
MLGAMFEDHTSPLKAFQYMFHVDGSGENQYWDSSDGSLSNADNVIPLDTVARIEMHRVNNSAFNVSDGVMETRYDVGTATAHANPVTLRVRRTGIRFYCGSEANRPTSFCTMIDQEHMFGGATSAWNPTIDSTVIFGYFKFEIPA